MRVSESVITAAILTIASVICAVALINVLYPSVVSVGGSFITTSSKLSDKIKSDIEIISEGNTTDVVYVWVKNVGKTEIPQVDNSDLFFGLVDDFQRVAYDESLSTSPSWNFTIENDDGDGRWDVGETIKITINQTATPGDYYVKFVIYNGVSDEDFFSI